MAIFDIFEANLALIFGRNTLVGSLEPRSAKIAKGQARMPDKIFFYLTVS